VIKKEVTKVLFISSLISIKSGVPAKVHNRLKHLNASGIDVKFLPIHPIAIYGNKFNDYLYDEYDENKFFHDVLTNKSLLYRIFYKIYRKYLYIKTIRCCKCDVIYFRYDHFIPILFSRKPYIIEHNTMEMEEFKTKNNKTIIFKEMILGRLLRKRAAGIIGVTPEIIEYEKKKYNLDLPSFNYSNTFDASDLKLKKEGLNGNKIIIFVGLIGVWHGLDRMIKAFQSDDLKDFKLVIVGDGEAKDDLIKLAKSSNLEKNVLFLGPMYGEELEKIMYEADLAVGSLAIHRKGLTQASPLKVRHYLAMGIPTINAFDDPDLPKSLPFILNLPANDDPVDARIVREYYDKIMSYRNICEDIKKFARENLTEEAIASRFKSFLIEVVNRDI